jgi:hypothetical protein
VRGHKQDRLYNALEQQSRGFLEGCGRQRDACLLHGVAVSPASVERHMEQHILRCACTPVFQCFVVSTASATMQAQIVFIVAAAGEAGVLWPCGMER